MAKQTFTTGQVLTAAQMTALQLNDYNQTVNAKVASYTLVASDAGTRITMSNVSATIITVNTSLFAAGDTLFITNIGAGACTITAGTATVSTASSRILAQYDSGTLYFTSTGVAIWEKYQGAAAGGSAALTFITGTTFSAVSSFSLPANTFSATYDNYLVRFQLTDASASSAVTLKLRASGTDTSSGYYSAQYRLDYQLTVTSLGENATTSWGLGSINTGGTNQQIFQYDLNIKQPFQTKHTMVNSAGSLGNIVSSVGLLAKVDTTSYDSLTFACDSGTITGNYRVYGYANS
jgi:hypothetical protein